MKQKMIEIAENIISKKDPAHDINHALRVLKNAEEIAIIEGGDLDVIIPAALFHDAIVYPKNSKKSKDSAKDSAKVARKILEELGYNEEKILKVEAAIEFHSFSNGMPKDIESQIIQDADKLECTGTIGIMRTFCYTGIMKREFYSNKDPFCEQRKPVSMMYAMDLFFNRLLITKDKMNTLTGRKIAEKRTKFLRKFLEHARMEILYLKK
jgi:uncharacterized protein